MAYNYSYNTLIDRFKAFADGHYLIRKFTHGQIDLADLDMDGEYPYMHVAPGNITPVPGAMQFGFEVLFMDLPRDKETKAEYQRESLSDCIRLAQDLITEIASSGVLFGNETQLGTQPTITPLIEEFKHVLTGVQISLVIELPYDWSACDIPANYSVGGSGSGGAGVALGITFKVNGTNNVVQNVLDLVEGTGISIVDNGDGSVTISNTGGGGGGGVAWGSITGTLSTQTDLQNALDAKADTSSLATVATSGSYNDLTNKPTIPTTLDSLTDVSASSPTNGQALVYDNNTKTWVPGTVGDMLKSVYDTDNDGTVDAAERIEIIVRNSTGVTLTKGQIVYLSGATGNRPNAVLADATDEITSSKTIGMVTANISNNTDGYVAVNGTLHDLDTSAFAAGDSLWLSETAGAMQANTPPAEPAHSVFIGYVARAHPTLGRVVLAIQNGYELNELHGVLVPSPSANDVLYYDGSTSLWKNKALSKSDVGLSNVDNTSDANKPISTATQTALNAKEPTITAGTSAQYYRGDKTFQTLNIASVSDSTTVGQNIVKLSNPSAIRYLRINADNSVSALSLAQLKSDIGFKQLAFKSADQSSAALAFADVTDLSFAVTSGKTYKFKIFCQFDVTNTSTGTRWAVNGPAFTRLFYNVIWTSGTGLQANQAFQTYDATSATANSHFTATNCAIIEGIVTPSANGTLIARFACELTITSVTCKAGSYIEYEEI